MTSTCKRILRALAARLGYEITAKTPRREETAPDFDAATRELFAEVSPFTLSGIERVAALRQAVEYIVRCDIAGDMVECGVWKGGSMMVVARTLLALGVSHRKLYLFDTFEGMSAPTPLDKDARGADAAALLEGARDRRETANIWALAPLESVQQAMQGTGYPPARIVYVQGKVEDTLPARAPEQIALLRLDTDWYESTYHELVHLFPRLAVGGVLLLDDYGHWQGARRAVDQYLAETKARVLLHRVDYTARICVKLDP